MKLYPKNARALYKSADTVSVPLYFLSFITWYLAGLNSPIGIACLWSVMAFFGWKGYLWFAVRHLVNEEAGQWAQVVELVNAGWHRGMFKRIDENRELLELLQSEAPDLLERCPWVEGWISTQDQFLVKLAFVTRSTNPHAEDNTHYPRPWPGKPREEGM